MGKFLETAKNDWMRPDPIQELGAQGPGEDFGSKEGMEDGALMEEKINSAKERYT